LDRRRSQIVLPQLRRSDAPYSSRIIKAGALLPDTKTLLLHWDTSVTVQANMARLRQENVFAKASRSRVEDILAGAEQKVGAAFEQVDGAIRARRARCIVRAHTLAQLGTLLSARSEVDHGIWRDEARRGRAGQAFKLGEPGVVDGTTANSLAASYRGPRQDGRVAKTKSLARNCLRILDQGLRPTRARSRTNRPLEKKPGTMAGLAQGWAGHPFHSRQTLLTSHGTPAPDARAPRLVTHWADRDQDRNLCLSSDSCLL
jgi:hypothetical protein